MSSSFQKNLKAEKSIDGMVVFKIDKNENGGTVGPGKWRQDPQKLQKALPVSKRAKIFFWTFIIIAGLLASGIYWLISPRAEVRIKINSEPFVNNIQIKVDSHIVKVNPDLHMIPGVIKLHDDKGGLSSDYLDIDEQNKGAFYKRDETKTLLFKKGDLEQIVETINNKVVPNGKTVFRTDSDVIEITVEEFNLLRSLAQLIVHTENKIIKRQSLAQIKQDIAGIGKEKAIEYLKSVMDALSVEIVVSPGLLGDNERLPYLGDRIDIFFDIL